MIKLSRDGLSPEQLNDIFLLVSDKKGKVYAAGEKDFEVDLTKVTTEDKREIAKTIVKLKKQNRKN